MSSEDDGWDELDQIDHEEQERKPVKLKGDHALSLLPSNTYSLQPDMISGWRPKLPSCPLPLSYANPYIDSLKPHLGRSSMYDVVYMGPRYNNTVQLNQQYSYTWKYREKYSINLDIIKEAITKVGEQKVQQPSLCANSIDFDSAFESGNLDLVVKVKKDEFDCFMRSDTNTKGHTNWYYFKVCNRNQVGSIKFNICNMTKNKNLYTSGMKPYCKVHEDGEWTQQLCEEVVFVERLCRYGFDVKSYQLQFTFDFKYPDQQVYFAYSIPYTYSHLEKFIGEIRQTHEKVVSVSPLCQSLGGIQLPLLTINSQQSHNRQNDLLKEKKKVAILTARIHPGQSNSSYLLEGFIRGLLNGSQESLTLLKNFVFYIVPMLNPDGVIAGNFRTSFSGKDLNRQYTSMNKYVFPEIYALGELCHKIRRSSHRSIEFYFDFHGHSSKKNLFSYGPQYPMTNFYYFKSKAFSKIIEQTNPFFSYENSIFTITKQKKSTGRAFMFQKMKIPMSFTFQLSNGLYQENKVDRFLCAKTILKSGEALIDGMCRYAEIEMRMPKSSSSQKLVSKLSKRGIGSSNSPSRRCSQNPLKTKRMNETEGRQRSGDEGISQDFMIIYKQIRAQKKLVAAIHEEGGSDSEGEDENLSKEESKTLFKTITKLSSNIQNFKTINFSNSSLKLLIKPEKDQITEKLPKTTNKRYTKPTLKMTFYSKPKKSTYFDNLYEKEKVPVLQRNFTMII